MLKELNNDKRLISEHNCERMKKDKRRTAAEKIVKAGKANIEAISKNMMFDPSSKDEMILMRQFSC
jgi:hypothetical protein